MQLGASRRLGALSLLALVAAAPSTSVQISGLVQHPQTLTLDQLRALPAQHVDATFTTMHGPDHHLWTGVLLWDLVAKAGLKDEPGKRTTMRHVLMVSGTDGYTAAIAIGEIDPMLAGNQILLAYRAEDDLKSLRLIVPGDKHGARDVHDVSGIEVR
jgi:DMSO/TMAO reductase YedYZ molybdopterin-dependent catalytic subunit